MNTFNKRAVEKNILDIKLSKMPFICDRNKKQNTNNGSFDNRTENVSVVKIRNSEYNLWQQNQA